MTAAYTAAQCAGKHPFVSASLANKVARKLGAQSYRCPDCGKWHVGHGLPRHVLRRPREAHP